MPRTTVGLVNHPSKTPNAEINSVEDLEAIWATSPAPAEMALALA